MASEVFASPMSTYDPGSSQERREGAKTWEELKAVVKDTRKLASTFASRVPSNFTFRTVQTADGPVTRLYFLGIPPKHRESTLLFVNVPMSPLVLAPTLQPCCLLEAFNSSQSGQQMSREEQLLRERKRLGTFGITSYEMTDEGHFVFPACNSLFCCSDTNITSEEPLFPQKIDTSVSGARMDPQMCPSNSDLVAFINLNDLWVVNTKTQQEVRLTFSNNGTGSLSKDPVSAGVPSFVVQEEFDRYTGYWWEPRDGAGSQGRAQVYRILYEEVDESDVNILQIYSPMEEEKGVDEYRYPRPGEANARSALKMVEFTLDSSGQICEKPVTRCLYQPLSSLFPSMEYLVRAGWTPDAKFVHCQLLNRKQTSLTLAAIPVECFVQVDALEEQIAHPGTSQYPPVHILVEDTSDIWVNVHDIVHFLPKEREEEMHFIWLSEKSGYRHLYKVSSILRNSENNSSSIADDVLRCEEVSCVPITSGDWEVSCKEIWVDKERKLIYFIGLKDTVLETHLYVVSYTHPGEPVRLTELGYSHSIAFDKECSMFVSVYSSMEVPPMSTLYQIQHTGTTVQTRSLGILMPSVPCPEYCPPERFQYESRCGHVMHGMFYRPHHQQPGVRYPVVLFVYGGPHVQLVNNSFKALKFLRLHTLASQGYAVVTIDNRGSSCRGLQFESHIKNRLGTTEIEDQVEGLQWLMSQVDFLDESRVAIHGWSYGGYLSLMGLAQRPDIFKVAVAGAPVVDWCLYDTGYTERYMDMPDKNSTGYQQGNVLHYIDSFPETENRLLIVHGLIDENVHFQHTAVLVNALVRACKPHQLQVYPNERHGIRNHEASEHYKTMLLSFLQKNL